MKDFVLIISVAGAYRSMNDLPDNMELIGKGMGHSIIQATHSSIDLSHSVCRVTKAVESMGYRILNIAISEER